MNLNPDAYMATSVKERAIETIEQLPQDASLEEVMERLYFLLKVERGLQQIEAGQVVSHEEAKRRKPIAQLVPVDRDTPDSFGALRGSVLYHDDIVAPDPASCDEPGL